MAAVVGSNPESPERSAAGFTLLEAMVVIVIVGISLTMLGMGAGTLTRSELKSSCNRVMSAARYAYNRAVIRGTTVRLSFELPGETFAIEEAHGQITLARPGDSVSAGTEKEGGQRRADVDPWTAARSRLQDTFHVALGASSFASIGGRFSKVQLGTGVRIVKLIVPHEPVPREDGTGAIYFFPGGQSEHAVLHLAQRDGRIYSVEIHPLTGRGRVHGEAFEPEELLGDPEDTDVSEVEER